MLMKAACDSVCACGANVATALETILENRSELWPRSELVVHSLIDHLPHCGPRNPFGVSPDLRLSAEGHQILRGTHRENDQLDSEPD